MGPNIIGISAFFHDSACCLISSGKLVAAAQEERFSRRKNDRRMPLHAFKFCLEAEGLSVADVEAVAFYENPAKRLARQLWSGVPLERLSPSRPGDAIREQFGYDGHVEFVDHHLSHAASAYFFSGFAESAILTLDGVGEWATATYGRAQGGEIEIFEEVHFPDSLGLLYSALTSYLGFRVNSGEYKVMGLAPYGVPRYAPQVRRLIQSGERGRFRLDMKYFDFMVSEARMFSKRLVELFGRPPREPESDLLPFHADVASSLQVVLEEIVLEKSEYLFEQAPSGNLCMAGGVALNCVCNGHVLREGPFKALFVQPAANDAGNALGAAAVAHLRLTGERVAVSPMEHVFLGPSYSSEEVLRLLRGGGITFRDFRGKEANLLEDAARLIAEQKVIGWFQGPLEFGPRALGGRSILADPRNPRMKEHINALVKKRESFRPFAPAVLREATATHFDLDHASPFMLETCQVLSELELPAITHVDGSARVQTVSEEVNGRFARLLSAFAGQTGCPVVLNTSFNMRGEPIVASPVDALRCFAAARLDALVIEDFIVPASAIPEWSAEWSDERPGGRRDVSHRVYELQ